MIHPWLESKAFAKKHQGARRGQRKKGRAYFFFRLAAAKAIATICLRPRFLLGGLEALAWYSSLILACTAFFPPFLSGIFTTSRNNYFRDSARGIIL